MSLFPALRKQKLADLCKFNASLTYLMSSRPATATGETPISRKQNLYTSTVIKCVSRIVGPVLEFRLHFHHQLSLESWAPYSDFFGLQISPFVKWGQQNLCFRISMRPQEGNANNTKQSELFLSNRHLVRWWSLLPVTLACCRITWKSPGVTSSQGELYINCPGTQ